MSIWRHWKYKNLTLVGIGLVFAGLLSQLEIFHSFLLSLGNFGYIGAFVAGLLFVCSFTIPTAILLLLTLTEYLSRVEISLLAGLGAVLGDLVIFRFVRANIVKEIEPIYNQFGGRHLTSLLRTRYFNWTLPVVGALIIASPLPDEIGVSLLGLSRMSTFKFALLSFILNAAGILVIISVSFFIRP